MSELNGTSENDNRRRLDQMQDTIQSMIHLVMERDKMHENQHEQVMAELKEHRQLMEEQRAHIREIHEQSMEMLRAQQGQIRQLFDLSMAEIREQRAEIQDLIILQKEHRIDIMALFHLRKKDDGSYQ